MTEAEKLKKAGQEVFDLIPPWDLEEGTTPESMADYIKLYPIDTIIYLLEIIEQLQDN